MIGEWVGMFLLTFFSLIGVFTLVRTLFERVLDGKKECAAVLVVPLRGQVEDVEYRLRGACFGRNRRVIAADYGIDRETREIALRLETEFSGLTLVESSRLEQYLAQLSLETEAAESVQ